MAQYLLNTTAIWLISLVMFDIFLRRESYHSYNRSYLLFTFLLGALLPIWQWQEDSPIYTKTFEKPLEQVMALKQTIVTTPTPVSTKINWELYLGYIYLLGVLFCFLLLVAEIIKIVRLYQNGKRSREGSCIIIETGKNYSPFSLFNLVFVNTRAQYTVEEWNMLIAHEQMHGLLFHFIDVLLVQIARIVFWFHPLVYIYQKKLMMLHEHQADKVSLAKPQPYGQFLVEQALLQTAPSISHSFNRSPIKNRIVMLTRKSSAASKIKMLVFIPLALVCIVCFSKNSFSQKKTGKSRLIVELANVPDTSMRVALTNYDPILSNPRLVCTEPEAEVTEFWVSFQPKGKDYIGPFTVTGSSRLDSNPRLMEWLKKLKESDTEKVTMFIENIHVKYKGEDVTLSPKFFMIHPHQ